MPAKLQPSSQTSTAGSQWDADELQRKQAELDKRAAELDQREQEMQRTVQFQGAVLLEPVCHRLLVLNLLRASVAKNQHFRP